MILNKSVRSLLCCALITFCIVAIPSTAQTTDSSRRESGSTAQSARLPSTAEVTADATGGSKDDEVLVLSPFSVQGDAVVGYQAKTTLASTRLRTKVINAFVVQLRTAVGMQTNLQISTRLYYYCFYVSHVTKKMRNAEI